MLEEIEKYNESVSEEKEIHEMSDLKNELINYGYDEYEIEDIYLLNEIRPEYFDEDDEYFWWADNGYLYSGNESDVIALIGNNEDTKESNTLYRYVIDIDGKEYGFIRGIDEIMEKGEITEDSKEIQRINSLLSRMTVPMINDLQEEKRCYFTEKGKSFYKGIIQQISDILNELGYKVKEITKETNNFIKIDKYQVLAKHLKNKNGVKTMHLIKKANDIFSNQKELSEYFLKDLLEDEIKNDIEERLNSNGRFSNDFIYFEPQETAKIFTKDSLKFKKAYELITENEYEDYPRLGECKIEINIDTVDEDNFSFKEMHELTVFNEELDRMLYDLIIDFFENNEQIIKEKFKEITKKNLI